MENQILYFQKREWQCLWTAVFGMDTPKNAVCRRKTELIGREKSRVMWSEIAMLRETLKRKVGK